MRLTFMVGAICTHERVSRFEKKMQLITANHTGHVSDEKLESHCS